MFVSSYQSADRNHNIKKDHKSLESVAGSNIWEQQ
jgi:hypothetical protein